MSAGEATPAFPPPDAQLINPAHEKLITPVDDRGLVMVDQLIEDIKATVDPEFIWPSGKGKFNTHHYYWEKNRYPRIDEPDTLNPNAFYNLPIHKGWVPIVFHNWLHRITEPPAVPSEEVMYLRTEGWNVASNLFRSVQRTIQIEPMTRRKKLLFDNPEIDSDEDEISLEYAQEKLEEHFADVDQLMEESLRIPPEFRIVEPYEFDTYEELAAALGAFVVPASMDQRQAITSQAA